MKTLAWSLSRMYTSSPGEVDPEISTAHVAASSARAVIAVGAWLDSVVDLEAARHVTQAADRRALSTGQARIAVLRSQLVDVIRGVAGR